MSKYVVINSGDIQKRIDELEKQYLKESNHNNRNSRMMGELESELRTLRQILSKSKPLTPIIENALKEGMLIQRTINDKVKIPATRIKDYINNLKLDI